MEIELVLRPCVEDVVDLLEALESKGKLALAQVALTILSEVPHALHLEQVTQRSTDSFLTCEKTHGVECGLVLVVAKLVLCTLGVDVAVFGVHFTCLVHGF